MRTSIVTMIFCVIITVGTLVAQTPTQKFEPAWSSLDQANPAPEWFKDAKFGIYFHWGVYSVPAFGNEWYPRNMYIRGSAENKHHEAVYGDVQHWPYTNFMTGALDRKGNFVQFAPKLKSAGGKFDPDEWAQLFADAGARFAGPVAEHHDGFSMWASTVNPWNAKATGPKLDLVGLLADAIRKKNLRLILSMHHAFNITGYYSAVPKTDDPALQKLYGQQGKEANEAFWLAKHKEIIDNYRPDIIWQDFNLHMISQPILLQFLSYYYNKAISWNKEVVATFKDGLNTKCAVLDYERGGPVDITDNYWLTDDALSSSSWCYTEGLRYYSKKQILHGFLDRISKNGNLLLNISPMADGSIPQEQQDILLAMGAWLKKYGEAVYATRAWETYGEGPTTMGAAFGVFTAPAEGTAKDIRFTRSKDNTTLYAILLGWDPGSKNVTIKSLSSERIDCRSLRSVELLGGGEGKDMPLTYGQGPDGLVVQLPERPAEELAYVLRLRFDGKIPPLDRYADLDCGSHYYLIPGDNSGGPVLGKDLKLTNVRGVSASQWKLERLGKGVYRLLNHETDRLALECKSSDRTLGLADSSASNGQRWRIDNAHGGRLRISNVGNPDLVLLGDSVHLGGGHAATRDSREGTSASWLLIPVCELKQEAYKPHTLPCTIEAEDFDSGCPGEAYYDKTEPNEGGQYRQHEGVDIENCSAGGYNVGWTHAGEWMAYTVTVAEGGPYRVSFYVAAPSDDSRLHLECDGIDQTGVITVPNTAGTQIWTVVQRTVRLNAGRHVLKVVVDNDGFNLDKMVFETGQ